MKGTMPYCGNTLTGSLRTRCHSWNHRPCIVKWVHNGFTVGITDRDWCNGFKQTNMKFYFNGYRYSSSRRS
eukprot:scaffold349871_cov44-Attheya_sp.AAC.1